MQESSRKISGLLTMPKPLTVWKWSRSVGSDSLQLQDCSLPGSSAHGIFQARILEWVADHHKLWKILQEMGIADHLTCLLKNLYAGQEATVRTGYGTTDWFHIRKGVRQGCILAPCSFNLYAQYIMRNAGLTEWSSPLFLWDWVLTCLRRWIGR